MFNRITSFITTALVISGVALAAPANDVQGRSADAGVNVEICLDYNFANCITIPVGDDTCINLTGGLSGWNDEISGAIIPQGFVCTFYEDFSCLSSGSSDNGDSVTLQGGDWPNFSSLPGDNGQNVDFNDLTSSFLCTPI